MVPMAYCEEICCIKLSQLIFDLHFIYLVLPEDQVEQLNIVHRN